MRRFFIRDDELWLRLTWSLPFKANIHTTLKQHNTNTSSADKQRFIIVIITSLITDDVSQLNTVQIYSRIVCVDNIGKYEYVMSES